MMSKPAKGNTPTKNVTNEELARMIARGFEHTASKHDLDNLRWSVDGLSGRVDGLEKRMETGFQEITHMLKPLQGDGKNHNPELIEIRERLDP